MADDIPTIQILGKENYFEQHLVPLPDALPYPALAPSSLRVRTAVLSLTVNNFTYAAMGSIPGRDWWDIHPLPASTPQAFQDATKYGRMNAWGYAEVLESTVPGIPKGSHVWGYVPMGTLAQDLTIRWHSNENIKDQIFVTNDYRQHVMPIYNRYFVYQPSSGIKDEIARKTDAVAYDSLIKVMHATSFLMTRFVFSSNSSRVVPGHPGPDDEPVEWTAQDADLSNATVLVFAPGSKVGLAFARLLRTRADMDPKETRPPLIIGVSSESSKPFVEGSGEYDAVTTTNSNAAAVLKDLGHKDSHRVVIFDFGGRAGAGPSWAMQLLPTNPTLQFVGVGLEIKDPSAPLPGADGRVPPFKFTLVNADDMRRRAIAKIGEEQYWKEDDESWQAIRKNGVKGFNVEFADGMKAVIDGWDRLAKGEVLPSKGLAFKL
ncbi:hypothetical protein F5Y18DRAFT_363801 [Xylariaceae sp. FL1019]|nr:hypothetical protein F5Y18DRAFT_363801 [Xylariaceae sp. FL1019]